MANHVIVAIYSGDSTFASSTSTLTLSTLFQTPTEVDSTSFSPVIGSSTTFTVHVEPTSGLNFPTGTVSFSIDGTVSSYPVAINGGAASYTTTIFSKVGKHTFGAVYSGDTAFA